MTTSMTDARYTSLHFTSGHLASLDFDPPPETGWGVMPGFDESLEIPPSLEPPRLDADETLPNLLHPSYPFGRPVSLGKSRAVKGLGVGNLLGSLGRGGLGMGLGMGMGGGGGGRGERGMRNQEDRWDELDQGGLVEREKGKEVPPGMAGAKRPPSPPSPALRPSQIPEPRSSHLQNLLARQTRHTPPTTRDQFDAPVPNETYDGVETGGDQEHDDDNDDQPAGNVSGDRERVGMEDEGNSRTGENQRVDHERG